MNKLGRSLADNASARSVTRKVMITALVGSVSFSISNFIFSSLPEQLAMAAGFGSIVLLLQFLVDFERRLHRVEVGQVDSLVEIRRVVGEGFANVNDATRLFAQVEEASLQTVAVTRLVRHAGRVGGQTPRLMRHLAQSEIDRVSEFLRQLSDQEATRDGEDRDWLLGLTRNSTQSICALSIPEVDAAENGFRNFWESDLGRHYLVLQREAILRDVRVRRVFVTDLDEVAMDPDLQRICCLHDELGIEVRLLYPSAIPHGIRRSLFDFIVFDDVVSYEVTPAAHVNEGESPMILSTRLIMRAATVGERVDRYQSIWESAVPWNQDRSPISLGE